MSRYATNAEKRPSDGNRHRLSQYARFLAVGLLVGILAIVLREAMARALPTDTLGFYSLSIIAVYALGILLSFFLHWRYTFRIKANHADLRKLASFFVVALTGASVAWLLSLVCRYVLDFDVLFGHLGASAAFAVGAVAASLLTYTLNARRVFRLDSTVSKPERSPSPCTD
ncbi:MAG: GtrA family protein [Chromatiales bacterium]